VQGSVWSRDIFFQRIYSDTHSEGSGLFDHNHLNFLIG